MLTQKQRKDAHTDVDTIFRVILPEYGMTERQGQIDLCHTILETMLEQRITLSDAGTGIGKTYAYLVAGVIFHKYRTQSGEPKQAIVVSTASIALQNAVHTEYIPFLSKALMEAGYITEPLLSVIRKGKSHYVCDQRLWKRFKEVKLEQKNKKNADALVSLQLTLDMDDVERLSGYDRRHVTVPKLCDCKGMKCRYKKFLADACSGKYLFQVCNHNLLLADAMHANNHMTPIMPPHCVLILDEAHKLPGVARQMFGRTLTRDDIVSLTKGLRYEHFTLAAQNLIAAMRPVVNGMTAESGTEVTAFEQERDTLLRQALKTLNTINRMIGDKLKQQLHTELVQMIATLSLFTDSESDIILYMDTDEWQRPALCASAADLSAQMQKVLWSIPLPIILTSGTLAVGKDFSRFRAEACLPDDPRISESVSLSPFDYAHNCQLYIPYDTPAYTEDDLPVYYAQLAEDIQRLIQASHGHALVLFNAYAAMSAVGELLEAAMIPYPIFSMSRNSPRILDAFKASGDGVLLATGVAWEGFDFPGDMVSMLIIPRLPFPIPNAFSEYQKEQCGSLQAFIRSIAVPDMQIRLRQGFGRAIRLETDTCVVAILDERAQRGRRFHAAVRQALPDMPMTGGIHSVTNFLHAVKDADFFAEVD